MRELTQEEVTCVSGGIEQVDGYTGAGTIMAVVGFGSLFTPIGPITAGVAIGSTVGLAGAQLLADLEDDDS